MIRTIALIVACVFPFALVGTVQAQYGNYEYGIFCDTCTTSSQFQSFAVANTPKKFGESVTHVANTNTNEIYTITMEWERENQVWYSLVTDVSEGSAAFESSFIAAKSLFSRDEIFVTAPPSTGGAGAFESFITSDQIQINQLILSNTEVNNSSLASIFWTGLLSRFNRYPIVVVLFNNGDTAQYYIVDPADLPVCCDYIEGSAKDETGAPLDAPATNPTNIAISGGGDGPGSRDVLYSTSRWRYRCSFLVDENDYVVDFLGCVLVP